MKQHPHEIQCPFCKATKCYTVDCVGCETWAEYLREEVLVPDFGTASMNHKVIEG